MGRPAPSVPGTGLPARCRQTGPRVVEVAAGATTATAWVRQPRGPVTWRQRGHRWWNANTHRGGGGGAGGYGGVITGATANTYSGTVIAGNGGNGGQGTVVGGNGGDGGVGLLFHNIRSDLNADGGLEGGDGGNGGASGGLGGNGGNGGAGIVGADLTVITSGAISGGTAAWVDQAGAAVRTATPSPSHRVTTSLNFSRVAASWGMLST